MSRRRRRNRQASPAEAFWGPAEAVPVTAARVRPTRDFDAVPRSLGEPPIPPNPLAAQRHLAVVYEEAVRTATALAAANDLLDDPEAEDQDIDGPG